MPFTFGMNYIFNLNLPVLMPILEEKNTFTGTYLLFCSVLCDLIYGNLTERLFIAFCLRNQIALHTPRTYTLFLTALYS